MKTIAEKTERQAERFVISLPIRVEAHEINHKIWREISQIESVSDIGAGFYLSRAFEVGQLLFVTIPLEKDLRRFDKDQEQYGVWGIIRHCHRTLRGKSSCYHVGVAFTGQNPPNSYRKNPQTIYKLSKINQNGLWEICEDDQPPSTRLQPRYSIPIEIYIAVCDAEENIVAHEKTVTENISANGAAVFSELELTTGDEVKVIKQQGGFSAVAIVRNRRIGADNLPRLHLEFVNARFPLEGID